LKKTDEIQIFASFLESFLIMNKISFIKPAMDTDTANPNKYTENAKETSFMTTPFNQISFFNLIPF